MKITKCIIVSLCLIIPFILSSCSEEHLSKDQIKSTVMQNLDLLNSSVNEMKIHQQNYFDGSISSTKKDAMDNNILESVINIKGIINIEVAPADKGIYKVRYNCGASGLAVSGAYFGFYYSSDNEQNIMSGKTHWVPKDNGWFEKSSSDERYEYGTYIEKITDNWFYYEEHF